MFKDIGIVRNLFVCLSRDKTKASTQEEANFSPKERKIVCECHKEKFCCLFE